MLLHGPAVVAGQGPLSTGWLPFTTGNRTVPFKHHAERRHHIPKPRYRVTNWAEYDAALQRRGSLTVWFTDEAIAAWRAEPRTTPGGQPCYSALAITTALTLRAVFRLALRQTEGLIGSIIALLGLALAVPDHSTMSRRSKTLERPPLRRSEGGPLHLRVDSTGLKLGGAGEWLVEKGSIRNPGVSCRLDLCGRSRIVVSEAGIPLLEEGPKRAIERASSYL